MSYTTQSSEIVDSVNKDVVAEVDIDIERNLAILDLWAVGSCNNDTNLTGLGIYLDKDAAIKLAAQLLEAVQSLQSYIPPTAG